MFDVNLDLDEEILDDFSSGFNVNDEVMVKQADMYGNFEEHEVYIISDISEDKTRVKVKGNELWWYSTRFKKATNKNRLSLTLYPDTKIKKVEAYSFDCPSCSFNILINIYAELRTTCPICGIKIY